MNLGKITPIFIWLLIASVLMITNGALIASNNSPIVLSSASPHIVQYSNWTAFATDAVNASAVSVLHQEPEKTVLVEALKTFNVSSEATEDRILTYDGDFAGNGTVRQNPVQLRAWLANELTVNPDYVSDNTTLSLDAISKESFWGRLVLGIPGTVEGGFAYFWLFLAALVLVMDIFIYLNPRRQKQLAPVIVVLSILSLPIGGGFIIGAIIGVVCGIVGSEWPRNFRETFIGRILDVIRLKTATLKALEEDTAKMQAAVLTVILVAVLSSFGVSLYVFNVNLMYSQSAFAGLKSEYGIFVQGATYLGMDVYFGTAAYITVGILKWLILSIIVYLVGAKVLGMEFKLSGIATAAAFVYVPEILQLLTPLLFPNEPILSKGTLIDFIPMTWPLALFYISRIWAFVILVIAIKTIMDLPTLRAIGVGLFTGMIYLLVNYLYVYPSLNLPGLRIQFADSSLTILIATSSAVIVAFLLGTFKKQA
jgi:hypothetical protein